jgi:hypothetical protein
VAIQPYQLTEIAERPTAFQNVHESVFRSWAVVSVVREMIADGWDRAAMLCLIDYFQSMPSKDFVPVELHAAKGE